MNTGCGSTVSRDRAHESRSKCLNYRRTWRWRDEEPQGAILSRLEEFVETLPAHGLPSTLAARTRRVYDRFAAVYPLSTMLFHSRAHQCAIEMSGLRDGMKVLEVATGS